MNIWNIIFALLIGIAIIFIVPWLFPLGPVASLVGFGGAILWIIGFLIYSSKKKVELSPVHMIVGFGFLFLALFGTVYAATFNVPDEWKQQELPYPVNAFFAAFGVSSDWLFLPAIIYLFIVPFIAVLAIIEGFMGVFTEMFGKWTHVIAIAMTIMTIPFGIFTRIVQSMFAALGMYAVGGFGLLFFFAVIGGVIQGLGRISLEGEKFHKTLEKEIRTEQLYNDLHFRIENTIKQLLTFARLSTVDAESKKYFERANELAKIMEKADKIKREKGTGEAIKVLTRGLKKIKV